MKQIYILHTGKAHYPEIKAYTDFLSKKGFIIYNGTEEDYQSFIDKESTILWCIMGLYIKKPVAKFIIHDYRSLSVGKLARLKDRIKRYFNYKPNLYIFQNEAMQKYMWLDSNIPSIILPMGVPDWIFDNKIDDGNIKNSYSGTYCYIGVMSKERQFQKVIREFLDYSSDDESFVLVGNPEKSIYEEFKDNDKLIFTGKVSQEDALAIVKNCSYSICYFPKHHPHTIQTPTKLLEYIALNSKIICNNAPSNLEVIKDYEINCVICDGYIFKDLYSKKTHKNIQQDYSSSDVANKLKWSNIMEQSNIIKQLDIF